MDKDIADEDYRVLAHFRWDLRRFLRFSEEAALAAGLSSQQHQALLALRAAPGATMLVGELADALFLRPHSATELVDRLERLGAVSRHAGEKDRRQVAVRITAEGARLMESLATVHREELRRIGPELLGFLARL
jgi:DNA-binding MarR family transcriptional regulator